MSEQRIIEIADFFLELAIWVAGGISLIFFAVLLFGCALDAARWVRRILRRE